MSESEKSLLNVLGKLKAKRTPIWFMRQAGRYLPEYLALREKASSFMDFCLTPDLASEATLQPLRRFDLDAAILFSDIMMLPHALGREVAFVQGTGPQMAPVTGNDDLQQLSYSADRIAPVLETIGRIKPQLAENVALIGFAGAPWTVACYMIQGKAEDGFPAAVAAAENDDFFMDFLLETIVNATKDYLLAQIDAGAEVVQLFDSHAGLLHGAAFGRCVIEPTRRLVSFIKEKYPHVPVIGFPRGVTLAEYQEYAEETHVDAISLDPAVDMDFALRQFGGKIVQGNLDPKILCAGGGELDRAATDLAEKIRKKHIFNLGHGVLPETKPENVSRVIEIVRQIDRGY